MTGFLDKSKNEFWGRPTDVPWALEVDPYYRPPEYAEFATFHPTFLYEALWDVLVCLVLLAGQSHYLRGSLPAGRKRGSSDGSREYRASR